ncbi:MAG: RDD family protein [Abditibacteriales bacterium]|nr:RDD family protein [Abditibacteriales bacterium]MDW8365672.1 RDD family protein [Abditibacteriales bacterium]
MRARHRILTPENVEFTFELAGLGSRLLAGLVDGAIIVGLVFLLLSGGSFVSALTFGVGMAITILAVFLVLYGYYVLLEWRWQGQTVGKRLLDIRVIDERGLSIDFYQALLRNLLRLIDAPLPFFYPGVFVALSNGQGKRTGDWVAGTVVVKVRQRVMPSQIIAPFDRYNSLMEDTALRQRVRRRLTVEEKDLLLQMCLRREQLALSSRQEIFQQAAAYFEQRLDVRREPFMSAEKFIQNLAAMTMEESMNPFPHRRSTRGAGL